MIIDTEQGKNVNRRGLDWGLLWADRNQGNNVRLAGVISAVGKTTAALTSLSSAHDAGEKGILLELHEFAKKEPNSQ